MDKYLKIAILNTCLILTSAQYHAQYRDAQPQYRPAPPSNNAPVQQHRPAISYPSFQQSQNADYLKPSTPRPLILSHRQTLTHDGGFKYAFTADNGLQQGETIAPDGTRLGQYSYVDPVGKQITVKYSAGKEGFRILEAPHVPQQPESAQHSQNTPPPQVYSQSQPSIRHYSNGPQLFGSSRQNEQQENNDNDRRYTHAFPQQLTFIHATTPVPIQAPLPRYLSYKNVGINEQQKSLNENAIQQEPEYNDEPGKPHSFGNGYSFEFSG